MEAWEEDKAAQWNAKCDESKPELDEFGEEPEGTDFDPDAIDPETGMPFKIFCEWTVVGFAGRAWPSFQFWMLSFESYVLRIEAWGDGMYRQLEDMREDGRRWVDDMKELQTQSQKGNNFFPSFGG